jgi:hypothetical protein
MTKERDLEGWLESNVTHHPEPKNVTLSEFEVDWAELSGSFVLALDSLRIEPKIRFSLDINGRMRFWMPMHHSPMGVPASYPMFEISQATQNAINQALNWVFGCFRPFGLNKDNGGLITSDTPTLDRLLPDNPINSIKARLKSGNKISIAV